MPKANDPKRCLLCKRRFQPGERAIPVGTWHEWNRGYTGIGELNNSDVPGIHLSHLEELFRDHKARTGPV